MITTGLNRNELIEAIKNIKNGRMARICYTTELPMKAKFAKLGYKIYKNVEQTARFGCKYDNLKTVIERKSDPNYKPSNKKSNYEWIVENKISHNNSTNKDYVRFVPMKKGSNKKFSYVFEDTLGKQFVLHDELSSDFKCMVQESYWTKKAFPEIQTVCLDNVLFIKSK